MNDLKSIQPRTRNQTLIIVEGKSEKNELFGVLLKCFPEIKIDMENIWVYGTNIYSLYGDIVKEYGEYWYEEDIDLPFVISKKENRRLVRYKTDFTNIILIFDYERQDTYFSEDKILKMQEYFVDATGVGRLYINYPMIESYQHIETLPDLTYAEKYVSACFERGNWYKNQVRGKLVNKSVELPKKISGILRDRFEVTDEVIRQKCIMTLLDISEGKMLEDKIETALQKVVKEIALKTAKYQMLDLINKVGYVTKNISYWKYMREIFQQIIRHNICKAHKLQEGVYDIADSEYRKCFEALDFVKILLYQNEESRDESNGRIWVLNTSVLFVADYNLALLEK